MTNKIKKELKKMMHNVADSDSDQHGNTATGSQYNEWLVFVSEENIEDFIDFVESGISFDRTHYLIHYMVKNNLTFNDLVEVYRSIKRW